MSAYPIILHHFEKSPFSEKVRVVFGLKKISWASVLISRIMPRPDLMPITGGYRRTPVLQIGADVYCDTQCIIRELERRFPQPTLFPDGNAGIARATTMWSDRPFFQNTVNLIFGLLADKVPQDFIKDREQLRGQKFDVEAMKKAIPQMRDQFRAHVGWIEAQLGDGRTWLLGKSPSLVDINAYMNVWYTRNHLSDLTSMLAEFLRSLAWEQRMQALGHGSHEELTSKDALAIAKRATAETPTMEDPHDPNGRKPGDRVSVVPDDYGKVPVAGEIISLSAEHIAIRRTEAAVGEVVIHFPRVGFLVLPAQ
jgi:glutathione S-transferase